jgi:hypothetical protein
MKKMMLLLVLAHLAQAATAATPAELKPFVEPGSQLVSVDAADLNGDGTKD